MLASCLQSIFSPWFSVKIILILLRIKKEINIFPNVNFLFVRPLHLGQECCIVVGRLWWSELN